jgi:benzylsuccinate CoA-transferase BbsF subunit
MLDRDTTSPSGPLSGVRIIDFTWAWAGPHGVQLLAMLGAEVIKIESMTRLDHSRVRSLMGGASKAGPDGASIFANLNAGKLSIRLDLRKEKAQEIVRRLAAVSDIAVQNMRPGALDRLGLGYESLRRVNPRIIMLSSSTVGDSGPERTYAGYAPIFAALSGIADITGYPDGAPIPLSGAVDLRVGTAVAFAALVALRHRNRTGEGQNIDLSSTELMSSLMGEAFLGYEMTGRVPRRMGNSDELMAPHGCYPCAGENQWVSIAVGSEDEWSALRAVVGAPDLDDPALADPEIRRQQQERLDATIGGWTRERTTQTVTEQLQRAGVAATPLLRSSDVVADRHVQARGVMQTVDHPVLGQRQVVGPPWKMEGAALRSRAPLIGEHSEYILGELLGLGSDEIEALEKDGVLN